MKTKKDIKALFENEQQYLQFHNIFIKYERVKQIQLRIQELQKRHSFVASTALLHELWDIEWRAASSFLQEQRQGEQVDITKQGFTEEELQFINDRAIGLCIVMDVAESLLMDIDEVLKHKDSTLSYEAFDTVSKSLTAVGERLSWLNHNSDYRKYVFWGDECDKVIDFVIKEIDIIKKQTREENSKQ